MACLLLPTDNSGSNAGWHARTEHADPNTRMPWLAGIVQCSPWANTLRCTSYRASCIRATNSRQCGCCSACVGSSKLRNEGRPNPTGFCLLVGLLQQQAGRRPALLPVQSAPLTAPMSMRQPGLSCVRWPLRSSWPSIRMAHVLSTSCGWAKGQVAREDTSTRSAEGRWGRWGSSWRMCSTSNMQPAASIQPRFALLEITHRDKQDAGRVQRVGAALRLENQVHAAAAGGWRSGAGRRLGERSQAMEQGRLQTFSLHNSQRSDSHQVMCPNLYHSQQPEPLPGRHKTNSPVVQDAHVDRLGALVLVIARRQRAHALAPNVARQVNLQRKTGKYSAQQCLSGQSAADSVQRATHTCPTRLEQRSQE